MNSHNSLKMHYEYTTYISDSPIGLQYYTVHLRSVKCIYDKLHNIYGPTVTLYYPSYTISHIEYWINDKRHNEHKPAIISYHPNGTISQTTYYINNQLHNERGPAVIDYHPNGRATHIEYWNNNKIVYNL